MPRNPQVSRRYAQALMKIVDDSQLSRAAEELSVFVNGLQSDGKIQKFFLSPVVSAADKAEVLTDLSTKLPTIYGFLSSVVKQDRIEYLEEIAAEFGRLREERAGELSVRLEIANPTMEDSVEEIRNFLQEKWKRQVKVTTTVNPELIGGFVASGYGKIFDASVRNQLENLRSSVVS
jgi:F-type H+-transporting ATPase subunit delta